jgi:hypothetical protein
MQALLPIDRQHRQEEVGVVTQIRAGPPLSRERVEAAEVVVFVAVAVVEGLVGVEEVAAAVALLVGVMTGGIAVAVLMEAAVAVEDLRASSVANQGISRTNVQTLDIVTL